MHLLLRIRWETPKVKEISLSRAQTQRLNKNKELIRKKPKPVSKKLKRKGQERSPKKSCEVAFSRLLLAGIPTFNRKTAHDLDREGGYSWRLLYHLTIEVNFKVGTSLLEEPACYCGIYTIEHPPNGHKLVTHSGTYIRSLQLLGTTPRAWCELRL
jgi:hypothetical protein